MCFRHLNQERDFVSSHEYISITEFTKGEITLPEFCVKAREVNSHESNSDTNYIPSTKVSE